MRWHLSLPQPEGEIIDRPLFQRSPIRMFDRDLIRAAIHSLCNDRCDEVGGTHSCSVKGLTGLLGFCEHKSSRWARRCPRRSSVRRLNDSGGETHNAMSQFSMLSIQRHQFTPPLPRAQRSPAGGSCLPYSNYVIPHIFSYRKSAPVRRILLWLHDMRDGCPTF